MSRDLSRALARTFRGTFANFAGQVTAEPLGSTDWASVTFTGARHRLRLTFAGAGAVGAAADFLAEMNEVEFQIPGHIVADLALVAEGRGDGGAHAWLEIEILTIEDQ